MEPFDDSGSLLVWTILLKGPLSGSMLTGGRATLMCRRGVSSSFEGVFLVSFS